MHNPSRPKGTVSVQGLKIYAYHGVDPQETKIGNMFEVDVSVTFDSEHAMRADRVDLTVNYAELVEIIKSEMGFPSKLLELVVYRIYSHIMVKYPQVDGGVISIYKLQPPISCELDKVGFAFEW